MLYYINFYFAILFIFLFVKSPSSYCEFGSLFVISKLSVCNMQRISPRARTWTSPSFLEREEREREREEKGRREWQLEKKRVRERNVQQRQQFGRCKRASIRNAALRFVYFSRKALRQHVATAACEWHVCIQRCAFSSSFPRFSLRRWTLIHGGWSPATRVCTQQQKRRDTSLRQRHDNSRE